MSTINLDGSVNVDFVSGPNGDDDVIMVDTDGDNRPDKPLEWDFNEDGDTNDEGERRITERQLYDAGLGQGEAAMDGSINLREERFNANHEPDIDDLPLPDGYDQNDPSTFERVWEWPPGHSRSPPDRRARRTSAGIRSRRSSAYRSRAPRMS